MSARNPFGELKRRNVIRVAGLYLVGAWPVMQVAGTVLPMLSDGCLKLLPFWDPLWDDLRFEKIVASLAPKESSNR